MANQRMFIRCKSCGSEKMLAKRLIGPYHTIYLPEEHSWDNWFKKHVWGFCGIDAGLDNFELTYEHVNEKGEPDGA